MTVENRSGHITGNSPSDSQREPTHQNHPDPEVKVDERPENNQPNPNENYSYSAYKQPDWRSRLAKIRNSFTRPADFWVALFTAVLAVETAISLRILHNTDEALHESSRAANEANQMNISGLRPWVTVIAEI